MLTRSLIYLPLTRSVLIMFLLFCSVKRNYGQIVGGWEPGSMSPKKVEAALPNAGTMSTDVNLFNGELQASEVLGTVSAPAGLSFTLNLSYHNDVMIGSTPSVVEGVPYGKGWSLNIPTISILSARKTRMAEFADTGNPSVTENEVPSEKEGDMSWYYLELNIPGVASGIATYKYTNTSDELKPYGACFVPETFEQYVEIWVDNSNFKAVLADGTTYSFDNIVMEDCRQPISGRHLSYAAMNVFNSGEALLRPEDDEISKAYHLPQRVLSTLYLSRIHNPNTKESIDFYYEYFGRYNYNKEFNQYELGPDLRAFFGMPFLGMTGMSQFVVAKDILLQKIYATSYVGIHEELELKYATKIFGGYDNLNVNDPNVVRLDSLYNTKVVYSSNEGFDNWKRYVHQKRLIGSQQGESIGSLDPYSTSEGVPSYRTEGASGQTIAFNHGFLESDVISNSHETTIPGDLYEVKCSISDNNTTSPGGNIDINVVTGNTFGASIGQPDSGIDLIFVKSEELEDCLNCYEFGRDEEIFSTFSRSLKWNTKGEDLSGGDIHTSNYFNMPFLPEGYKGLQIQVGPANSDHLFDMEVMPISAAPITNSYRAYRHKYYEDIYDVDGNEWGVPFFGPMAIDPIPHNFGIGMPWSCMLDPYRRVFNLFSIYDCLTPLSPGNEDGPHLDFVASAGFQDHWWKTTADASDYSNRPTYLDQNVFLYNVELVRHSKNTYMLAQVNHYVYDGDQSVILAGATAEGRKLMSQKVFRYNAKPVDMFTSIDISNDNYEPLNSLSVADDYNNNGLSDLNEDINENGILDGQEFFAQQTTPDILLDLDANGTVDIQQMRRPRIIPASEFVAHPEKMELILTYNRMPQCENLIQLHYNDLNELSYVVVKPFFINFQNHPDDITSANIYLRSIIDVPTSTPETNASDNSMTGLWDNPMVQLKYEEIEIFEEWEGSELYPIDFIPSDGYAGPRIYALTEITNKLGGKKSIEYFALNRPETYVFERYVKPTAIGGIDPKHFLSYPDQVRQMNLCVRSVSDWDGTAEPIKREYEYDMNTFVRKNPSQMLYITSVGLESALGLFGVDPQDDFDWSPTYERGFGVVTEKFPHLGNPESVSYTKHYFYSTLPSSSTDPSTELFNNYMFFGKLMRSENYNPQNQKVSEAVSEYEVSLAYENGFTREDFAHDHWQGDYDDYFDSQFDFHDFGENYDSFNCLNMEYLGVESLDVFADDLLTRLDMFKQTTLLDFDFFPESQKFKGYGSTRKSFFIRKTKDIQHEFDINGICFADSLPIVGGFNGNSNTIHLDPIPPDFAKPLTHIPGGHVINNFTHTATEKNYLLNVVQNTPSVQTLKSVMENYSQLEDAILAALAQRTQGSIYEVISEYAPFSNEILKEILQSKNLKQVEMMKLISAQVPLDESLILEQLNSPVNTTEKVIKLKDFLLTCSPLSNDVVRGLADKADYLPANLVVDVLSAQPAINESIMRTFIHNADSVPFNYIYELITSTRLLNDSIYWDILNLQNLPEQNLLLSLASGVAYPGENILTLIANDTRFDGAFIEKLFDISPYPINPSIISAALTHFSLTNDGSKWTNTDSMEQTVCFHQQNCDLAIETITEYTYYDANYKGITTSEGYKVLMDLEELPEIWLKYEPSWMLFKKKTYSPQLPQVFSEQKYFYYYDLDNRYDRMCIPEYAIDPDWEIQVSTDAEVNSAWIYGAAGEEYESNFGKRAIDALVNCKQHGNRSLVFETVQSSKGSGDKITDKSAYYLYDKRWEVPSFVDSVYVDKTGEPCTDPYIPDDDIDGDGGGDGGLDPGGNGEEDGEDNGGNGIPKMAPIKDILKNRLMLRDIYTQVTERLDKDGTGLFMMTKDERDYLSGTTDRDAEFQLLDFKPVYDTTYLPSYWKPLIPTATLHSAHFVSRNIFTQPVEVIDAHNMTYRYVYETPRFEFWDYGPECQRHFHQIIPYTGRIKQIVVGCGRPDSLVTSYTYVPASLQLLSETDPNGNINSYTYDEWNRPTQVFRDGVLLAKNRFHTWNSDADSFEDLNTMTFSDRAAGNWMDKIIFNDESPNGEVEQTRAYIDPMGREFHAWSRIASMSVVESETAGMPVLHSGKKIFDRWARVVQEFKPFVDNVTVESGDGYYDGILLPLANPPASFHYAASVYENDPRGRLLHTSKPSENNGGTETHLVSMDYRFITGDALACELNLALLESEDMMPHGVTACVFKRVKTTDEDAKILFEYTNALGQKVADAKVIAVNEIAVTLYFYDEQGNVCRTVSPEKLISVYKYNFMGKLYEKTTPDEGTTRYMYNKRGQVVLEQDEVSRLGVPMEQCFSDYSLIEEIPEEDRFLPYYRQYCYNDFGEITAQSKVMIQPSICHTEPNTNALKAWPVNALQYHDSEEGMQFVYYFKDRSTLSWLAKADFERTFKLPTIYLDAGPISELIFSEPMNDGKYIMEGFDWNPPLLLHASRIPEKIWAYRGVLNYPEQNGVEELTIDPNMWDLAFNQHPVIGSPSLVVAFEDTELDFDMICEEIPSSKITRPVEYVFYSYHRPGQLAWEAHQINGKGITSDYKGISYLIEYPEYDLRGNALNQLVDIHLDHVLDMRYNYSFDARGRLENVYISMSPEDAVGTRVVQYVYDDARGKVLETNHCGTITNSVNMSITNDYDIRDRLTKIHSKLYEETLSYDNTPNESGLVGQFNYNGNINAVRHDYLDVCSSLGSSCGGLVTNYDDFVAVGTNLNDEYGFAHLTTRYAYTYDGLNRLTNADALINPAHLLFGDTRYTFDRAGNFTYMKKNGLSESATSNYLEEEFSYHFMPATSKLLSVEGLNGTLARNYVNDLGGNLKADDFRRITNVHYDRANLPSYITKVETEDGADIEKEIHYIYNAADARIAKHVMKRNGNDDPTIYTDEIYLRDAAGRELAIIERASTSRLTWYVHGTDRVAKYIPDSDQMAEIKSDPSELSISDPEPGASQVSYPLKLAMGTVAGGRVTYYHAAYLQLRLSANDPVIHFLKQAEVTLKDESEFKALLSNTKPDTRAALLNIWNGGHGGPVVDPDNNPGPSPLPPTIIVVEPLICGCAVQPMLPVTDENFYVPAEFIEFENHSIKELSFYLYDHLGNTRMTYRILPTASATFTIEEMLDYDPYGKILRQYSTGGEKYLTTQHQRDTETGLDYRGARFYDCDVARFLSLDPLAVKYPSMSGYMYVGGMVSIAVDPDGRRIRGSLGERLDFRRYQREVSRRLRSGDINALERQSLIDQRQTIRNMRQSTIRFELSQKSDIPKSKQEEMSPSAQYVDESKNERRGRIVLEYSKFGSNVSLAGSVAVVSLFSNRQITLTTANNWKNGAVYDEVDALQFATARNSMRSDNKETPEEYIDPDQMKGRQISLNDQVSGTSTHSNANWGSSDTKTWEQIESTNGTSYYMNSDGNFSSPKRR